MLGFVLVILGFHENDCYHNGIHHPYNKSYKMDRTQTKFESETALPVFHIVSTFPTSYKCHFLIC